LPFELVGQTKGLRDPKPKPTQAAARKSDEGGPLISPCLAVIGAEFSFFKRVGTKVSTAGLPACRENTLRWCFRHGKQRGFRTTRALFAANPLCRHRRGGPAKPAEGSGGGGRLRRARNGDRQPARASRNWPAAHH